MKRQTTHPSKRSRQERALEQRRQQLNQWRLDPNSIAENCPSGGDGIDVEAKIETAQAEIATLERILGVRHEEV